MADYNSNPDMTDGGQLLQGDAFKKGGVVYFANNPESMKREMMLKEQHLGRGGNPKKQPLTMEKMGQDVQSFKEPLMALADLTAGGLRGMTAGTLGLAGTTEGMGRSAINAMLQSPNPRAVYSRNLPAPQISEDTFFPTVEEMKSRMPPAVPADKQREQIANLAQTFGEMGMLPYTSNLYGAVARGIKSLPKAVSHGAQEFAKAAGQPAVNVIKEKGGNWLGGNIAGGVGKRLESLKTTQGVMTPEEIAKQQKSIDTAKRILGAEAPAATIEQMEREIQQANKANILNQWIERNVGNYVKNQMGTPEDPVRLMLDKRAQEIEAQFQVDMNRAQRTRARAEAETDPRRQANMMRQAQREEEQAKFDRDFANEHATHLPKDEYGPDEDALNDLKSKREEAGFAPEGMAKSEPAKRWENLTDEAVDIQFAKNIQKQQELAIKAQQAEEAYRQIREEIENKYPIALKKFVDERGANFTDEQLNNIVNSTRMDDKASFIGLTDEWKKLQSDYLRGNRQFSSGLLEIGQENPFVSKLDPETKLYSAYLGDLGIDHVVDVIKQDLAEGRIRPEQLNKLTMDQAIKRTAEFNAEQAKKMRETAIKQTEGFPVHKEYPEEGYKWIELKMPDYNSLPLEERKQMIARLTEEARQKGLTPEDYIVKYPESQLAEALKYEGDTMGHCVGGYCPDVVSGRSRIFSLRDKRGEPHVTVEVEPVEKHPIGYGMKGAEEFPKDFRYENGNIAPEQHQQIYQRAKQLFNPESAKDVGSHRMDVFQQAADEVLGKPAPAIRQIKGKQNAAPKADYLPYVQDFVRSGEWSEVGDLKNTGLRDIQSKPKLAEYLKNKGVEVKRYLPEEEYLKHEDDFLMDQLYPKDEPPAEGMKAGGAVHMKDGGEPTGFINPNIARQGAKARANAAKRDVNTLPDPKTYAFVSGLLGTRPDEMGFSVMHPDAENIRKAGEVGFAIGTGASVMPLLRPLQAGATKAGMAAEKALAQPVTDIMQRGGKGAELLGSFATPPAQVVKEKGGNWLKGQVESSIAPLKVKHEYNTRTYDPAERLQELDKWTPELIAKQSKTAPRLPIAIEEEKQALKPKLAINEWIDKKLGNYIKNEMGTPEDPVRALAEKGITHLPPDTPMPPNMSEVWSKREEAGFPKAQGTSRPAQVWESWADKPINFSTTGEAMNVGKGEPWMEKVDPFTRVHGIAPNWGRHIHSDLGFDHIIDVLKEDLATGRITPEQLSKISMPQAVQRTHEYNQELAKKMAESRLTARQDLPVLKEYPEGYKWMELNRPGAFAAESDAMGHSVRGYEPPPEHPDWVPEAGGKGYPEYGFGGWEAIKSGKAKVYSLVDKKGEPHVTIEVAQPEDPFGANGSGFVDLPSKTRNEYQNIIRQWRRNNPEVEYLTDAHINQALAEAGVKPINPPEIHQIKGKQNAEPSEAYKPFVRDFQRTTGHKIEDDWQNSGFDWKATGPRGIFDENDIASLKEMGHDVPEYLTDAEKEHLVLKLYEKDTGKDFYTGLPIKPPEPPTEGMKRGGKVHFAGNTANMKRELMLKEPHYQVGGIIRGIDEMAQAAKAAKFAKDMKTAEAVAKLMRAPEKSSEEIRAIAQRMAPQIIGEEFVRGEKGTKSIADKTQKQFAREKEIKHDIRPTVERPEPAPVDFEKLKGSVMVGIPGDPTISGQALHSVAGTPLQSPSPQHGGPLYGLGRPDEAFWASGEGAANKVQNLVRKSFELYDAPVVGNYIMMGPESINYAQHFADANLSAIDPTKMTKRQIEDFNNLIREGYPYKKKGEDFQRVFPSFPGIEHPEEAYLHFSMDPELRKHFNSLMQMPTVTQKFNLPSGIDVRHAITEPELRNVEAGVTGKAMGQMNPNVKELSLSEHPTYSHNIPGKFLGSTDVPYPYELTFPDIVKSIRENPKQAPYEFGTLQYSGPRQIIDPQLIDELSKYREFIKQYTGKKKGGAVSNELITVKRKRK